MVERHLASHPIWMLPVLAAAGLALCGLGVHHSRGGLVALTLLAVLGVALLAALHALRALRHEVRSVTQARQALHRIAEGDLSLPVVVEGSHAGALLQSVQAMQSRLADVIDGVRTAATDIGHASDGVRHGQLALADRSLRQAAGLRASAASVDEITASVRRNAENTEQARGLARQASTHAEEGSGAVANAVGAMDEISECARKIVEITALIDGIAFQTNILALNAAVEAARAGEQGRGFSVVAGEVRVLAQRAGAASREIKALIDDAAQHIEVGARHVNGAGASMDRLVASVRRVNDYIEGISTATQEQRQGIEEANRAVAELDEDTRENHAMIEQAGRTAQALQAAVAPLAELVADFQLPEPSQERARQSARTGPRAGVPGLRPPLRGKPTATRLPTA